MWVKAQIGIEGNEAADKLDKAAAQDKENQNTVFDRTASDIKGWKKRRHRKNF